MVLGGICFGGSAPGGGVCSRGGGLLPGEVSAPGGPGGDPPDGYCYGRYASYLNAFLLEIKLPFM